MKPEIQNEEEIGVLLLNLGGPETLDDVRSFLFNLFSDPDIIRLPFRFMQKPIARLIANRRHKKSSGYYSLIGGGSPLRKITDEQAQALKSALYTRGIAARVYVAMRYWHPFTEETIEQIKNDGVTRLIVLPLYPQFSISTTGSSLNRMNEISRSNGVVMPKTSVICTWQNDAGYIKALSSMVKEELGNFSNQSVQGTHIIFSAHSVPVSYVEKYGDPYLRYTEETVRLVMEHIGVDRPHMLSFQSKVGPVKWLEPSTDSAIRKLAAEGVSQMLLVPVSFVSEHIETLYELDILYRNVADEVGVKEYRRVPALNCQPEFIAALANLVEKELQTETESVENICPYYSVNCQSTPLCKISK